MDKRTDAMCYLFDVPTTICAAVDVQTAKGMEGENLMHVINGDKLTCRTEIFGVYRDVQRSIRTDRWKLIRYPQINKTQLFDLQSDPDEMKDLAGDKDHAERVKDMLTRLERNQKDFGDKQPLSTDKPMPLVPRNRRIAVREPHASSRRCVIKARYVPLTGSGVKAARRHLA